MPVFFAPREPCVCHLLDIPYVLCFDWVCSSNGSECYEHCLCVLDRSDRIIGTALLPIAMIALYARVPSNGLRRRKIHRPFLPFVSQSIKFHLVILDSLKKQTVVH